MDKEVHLVKDRLESKYTLCSLDIELFMYWWLVEVYHTHKDTYTANFCGSCLAITLANDE